MYILPQSQRLLAVLLISVFLAGYAVARQSASVPEPIRFYPAGDDMLFSMYSLYEPEVSRARSDGFTAIGPYYGKKEDLQRSIGRAKSAQLPILYNIGPKIDFKADPKASHDRELEMLISEVASASKNPKISAWVMANEEMRHWRPAEMSWLKLPLMSSVNMIHLSALY
jgi:hypothetical protein